MTNMTGAPPLKIGFNFLWVNSIPYGREIWIFGESWAVLFNPNDKLNAKTLLLFNATSIFTFSIYYFDMSWKVFAICIYPVESDFFKNVTEIKKG